MALANPVFLAGVCPLSLFHSLRQVKTFQTGKTNFLLSVEPNQATIQLTGLREMLVSYLCTWQCVKNANSLGNVLHILDQQQLEQFFFTLSRGRKKKSISVQTVVYLHYKQQLLSITGIQLPE